MYLKGRYFSRLEESQIWKYLGELHGNFIEMKKKEKNFSETVNLGSGANVKSVSVNGEDWCCQNTLVSFDLVNPVPFFDIGIPL